MGYGGVSVQFMRQLRRTLGFTHRDLSVFTTTFVAFAKSSGLDK